MKKILGIVVVLAFAAVLLPAAFGQDQSSQPSASQPSASQPSPAEPAASQPSPSQPAASQPAEQQPSASQPSAQQPAAPGSASQAGQNSSFSGTIVKAGDKYVLKTDTATYQLDDQDKAKQFENKQVTVMGSLDQATSIVHVTDIVAASK